MSSIITFRHILAGLLNEGKSIITYIPFQITNCRIQQGGSNMLLVWQICSVTISLMKMHDIPIKVWPNVFIGSTFFVSQLCKRVFTMASLRHILMGRNDDYFLNYIDYSKIIDAIVKLLLVIRNYCSKHCILGYY